MELRTCERCDKTFIRSAPLQVLCPRCIALEEEEFTKVKDYLFQYPGANMEAIAEALEIPQKTVLRFLQSGRLEIKGSTVLRCHSCGVPIEKGTMCEKCQRMLLKEIESIRGPEKVEAQQSPNSSHKSTGFHIRKK